MGDRWKSLPEIDQSYEKMEMEWIAGAIENDWKLTERRFFKSCWAELCHIRRKVIKSVSW